ncbi:hypothetical protein [Lactobacillus amylovorus]|uniref:DUF536 domain-containing protein n=1 Tax=Lactobacillus amylovorus TaxID=1604 RepID=A0AAW6BCD5_LACAM|nr:hypothetical protein [Lactobacillus amylovorus]MDB6247607.1 hypothetical protein [Lactobacillus amylovorus]
MDKLAEQKKEYDSKLDEQKESYERLIAAKDDDISNLRDQQNVSNEQIKQLTMVTKQAQSLNLADKSPEQIKMLKGDTETKPEQSSSKKEVDNRQISESEKPHKSWWQRIF